MPPLPEEDVTAAPAHGPGEPTAHQAREMRS